MKKRMGNLERQFFAALQARGAESVRQGDLVEWLRLAPLQENRLFHRLAAAGWIARVRRGLYLAPPRLPLGGKWSPDEALALNALLGDKGGRYQICGPNAFQRYGYDQQIPTRVFAYNNRFSGRRRIGAMELILIKVADDRLGGTVSVPMASGGAAIYSSRVRSLVDAVDDWARFASLPRAYGWIKQGLSRGDVTAKELVLTALDFGGQSCRRRIGALLETEGTGASILKKLETGIRNSKSVIAFDPLKSRKGRFMQRWGVIVNATH